MSTWRGSTTTRSRRCSPDTGSADREAARRYRARSGGNPFFLDELLRAEREAGPGSDRCRPAFAR